MRAGRYGPWRVVAAGVALAVVAGLVASVRGDAPPVDSPRPNVVLVVADDLDVATARRVPGFERLVAERGTRFGAAYATDSLCCPSRASILRGQYVRNHGVRSNVPPEGGFPAFRRHGNERSNLATWLHGAGYRTGLFGKYLNRYPAVRGGTHVPPGWDAWHAGVRNRPYDQHDYTMVQNGERTHYGAGPRSYNTDVIARRVRDFVATHGGGDQPLFAYVAPYAPHLPAPPPHRYAERFAQARAPRTPSFDQANVAEHPSWVRAHPRLGPNREALVDGFYRDRLGATLAVRDLLRGLLATLRRAGELDETYVVLTSDNGFHLGQHRSLADKRSPYEEDIRVPLAIRGPGIPAGRTTRALTSLVDLAPTVADLTGVSAPGYVDGRSLRPLLRGGIPTRWRQGVLVQHFDTRRPAPTDPDRDNTVPWLYNRPALTPPPFQALRTGRYTYVEYATGERELYDNVRDPAQLDNIVDQASNQRLARLSARLDRLAHCAGPSCRTADRLTAQR